MISAKITRDEPPYLILVNSDTGQTFDLLRKKTLLVARAGFNGDLEIHGDTTVSRSHAELSCIKKKVDGEAKIFMQVLDKKSKFGTYINEGINLNQRIESDHPIILSQGDSIRFGLTDCGVFQLLTRNFNVCTSTLKRPDKMILEKTLKNSKGINMQRDFEEQTTHLCMNSITITEKALISLALLRPIVTVQYFIDLHEALLPNSSKALPFTAEYLPPLAESILNPSSVSLDINFKRKGLFSGKTFLCSSEAQVNRIAKIIKAAGGDVLNYVDCHMSVKNTLSSDDFIFMQQDPCSIETGNQYQLILEKLQSMNKRPIPENDVGLSIIFASTEKHCNPRYNILLINLQSQSKVTESQAPMVLALDTEEVKIVDNSQKFSVSCLPDSLPQTNGPYKRPLEVIMDSDDVIPNNNSKISRQEEINESLDMKDVENIEPLKKVFVPKKSINIDMSTNSDSCVTHVPSFQNISKENNLSNFLQVSVTDKNKNYTNNLNSDSAENNVISKKRKNSNICSVSINEDDPFDYMDVDEIEELSHKKPKMQFSESIYQPILATSSKKKNEQPTFEESKLVQVIDPLNIMNLLADVKGSGQFIDSNKLPDKSSIQVNEDFENNYLLNSVIVQTVNMVKSRPLQTKNSLQESHSSLKNFKKFKKKGPTMRIPHIVPLEISHID